MKQYLYAIYDSKVKTWGPPQMIMNKGAATRSWTEAANDPQLTISKYPSDFTMFEIAEYDLQTGSISVYQTPVSLGVATQFLKEPSESPTLPFKQRGGV